MIRYLNLPSGSHGLDAGCGIGLQLPLLAEAVGQSGHVTGLDISPEFLKHAGTILKESGMSERITFKQGDIYNLPFEDNTFDWLWSADCAGYYTRKPHALTKELGRVVKPGGLIALLIYSSQMLLPGHPLLEARLNATSAGIAPFIPGMSPETHYLRALGWFQKAGFENPSANTFVGNFHAPLSDDIREALSALFRMRWDEAESEVRREDWQTYQRLCQPESPNFILKSPDYYAFFTYSLFHATIKK